MRFPVEIQVRSGFRTLDVHHCMPPQEAHDGSVDVSGLGYPVKIDAHKVAPVAGSGFRVSHFT